MCPWDQLLLKGKEGSRTRQGEVGLDIGRVKALDSSVGELWSVAGPPELSLVGVKGLDLYIPGGTLIGFRLPLEG